MTQNLRISGVISAEYSNFTGDDFNVSAYNLSSAEASYADHCDSANGYNYACSRVPDATDLSTIGNNATAKTVGAWYNYVATTAGTIIDNSNTASATEDICPAGWHLPTGPNTAVGTDANILIGNTISGYQTTTAGAIAFDGIASGSYCDGELLEVSYGHWWLTATNSTKQRRMLSYHLTAFRGNNGSDRSTGHSIRCVRTN